MTLLDLDPDLDGYDLATVEQLRRVATHVLARARHQATGGRISLRVTPGGFGTPELPDGRRVRVVGTTLVVESDAAGEPSTRTMPIRGSSLSGLAYHAGAKLGSPLDVGQDTPSVGQAGVPVVLDVPTAEAACRWFGVAAAVLDLVLVDLPRASAPTMVRVWPEHFDVAVDVQAREGVRANLGASPGDAFMPEPYLYVGPWTPDRPGGGSYWNASFGAARPASSFGSADDAAAFLAEGVGRLATRWAPPAVS
jgi:hypothetical protein